MLPEGIQPVPFRLGVQRIANCATLVPFNCFTVFISGMLVWGVSTYLIYLERNYDLPGPPGRHRHSLYLTIFWGVALLVDTMYFLNVRGTQWFFALTK